jgi:hypothetical protein
VQQVMSDVAEKCPNLLIKVEEWNQLILKADEERETHIAEARLADLQQDCAENIMKRTKWDDNLSINKWLFYLSGYLMLAAIVLSQDLILID